MKMCAMEHHQCNTAFNLVKKIKHLNYFFFFREDDDKPKPNVYIPPNLRKKTVSEEQIVSDRAADGSEIVDTEVIEAPNDVRTDPDGQSSEPELLKDQPETKEQFITEGLPVVEEQSTIDVDNNDSGFIECGKKNTLIKVIIYFLPLKEFV